MNVTELEEFEHEGEVYKICLQRVGGEYEVFAEDSIGNRDGKEVSLPAQHLDLPVKALKDPLKVVMNVVNDYNEDQLMQNRGMNRSPIFNTQILDGRSLVLVLDEPGDRLFCLSMLIIRTIPFFPERFFPESLL